MPLPDSAFTPCIHCDRGRNGDQSCAAGRRNWKLAPGCFLGRRLPRWDTEAGRAQEACTKERSRRK